MMDAKEQVMVLEKVILELESALTHHKGRLLDAERDIVYHRDKVAAYENMIEAVKTIHR